MSPRVEHGVPKVRVFIFGLEVTADAHSFTFSSSDGSRAPSACEIVLSNELDKYVITQDDLAFLYGDERLASNASDELGRTNFDRFQAGEAVPPELQRALEASNYEWPDKRLVLKRKIGYRVEVNGVDIKSAVVGDTSTPTASGGPKRAPGAPWMSGDACRYPMHVGDCIFHSNDSIRIFLRDPLTLEWYYGFSGFVSDWTETCDEHNKRLVTIRGEDVLRVMRYARIATNPGIYDVKLLRSQLDLVYRTFNKGSFVGLSLPELVHFMFFGSSMAGLKNFRESIAGAPSFGNQRVGAYGDSDSKTTADSSGAFNHERSRIFLFPGEGATQQTVGAKTPLAVGSVQYEPLRQLSEYQRRVDHLVLGSDMQDLVLASNPDAVAFAQEACAMIQEMPTHEERINAVIMVIGEHPEYFPVEGGVFILMPNTLAADIDRKIIERDFIDSVAAKTQFRSRLSVLYDLVHRIDFSLHATPKGDVLVEMPLYDFDPHNFADATTVQVGATDYSARYSFGHHDVIRWDRAFSDEKVRTQAAVSFQLIQAWRLGKSEDVWAKPGFVMLDHLVPQFGARLEEIDPTGFISSKGAANYYAYIKLNQLNADAKSAHLTLHYRAGLGPNRPILFAPRACVATVRSVQTSIVWGQSGSVSMSLGVNYQRGWSGQFVPDSDVRLYEPLGGFASRPLNYAALFAHNTSPDGKVYAEPPASTKPLSGQNELWTTSQNLSEAQLAADAKLKLLAARIIKAAKTAGLTLVGTSGARTTEETAAIFRRRGLSYTGTTDAHAEGRAVDISGGIGDMTAFMQLYTTPGFAAANGLPSDMRVIVEGEALQNACRESGVSFSPGPKETGAHLHFFLPAGSSALTGFADEGGKP